MCVLWIGAWGVHRYQPETDTFKTFLPDPAYPVRRAREEPDNLLNVSADQLNVVWSMATDREGVLWVGTRKGLLRFDTSIPQTNQRPKRSAPPTAS